MDKETVNDMLRDDKTNQLVADLITEVLQVPGVQEAVTVQALKDYGDIGLKELYDHGVPDLKNLPWTYIWNNFIGLEV